MRKWFAYILLLLALVLGVSFRASAASMTSSDNFLAVLKQLEGFHAKPYWDHSQWSVGYGTKCPDAKLEEYKKTGITKEIALELLKKELGNCESNVNAFAAKYGLTLKQHQFDALVSFTYNCGPAWMQDTHGYFNTAVRDGDTGNRLIYGMCLYSTAGGEYILINRRMCEADMYINGNYHTYTASENFKWVFLDGNGGRTRYSIYGYDSNDPQHVSASFTQIPAGTDAQGNAFAYTLGGWYTADGVKVDKLDDRLTNGQVLYAQWKDPRGKVETITPGKAVNLSLKVTADTTLRTGPGAHYDSGATLKKGAKITVTSQYDERWGKTKDGWVNLSDTDFVPTGTEKRVPWCGTVIGTSVNYRTEPVVNHTTLVGQKYKGDVVEILQEYNDGSYTWGQMGDGYWIRLDFVSFQENLDAAATGIKVVRQPYKTTYWTMQENLQLEGSVLLITFSDGTASALSVTREMVVDYKAKDQENTVVTLSHRGHTTTMKLKLATYTVTFRNWDGSLLSEKKYNYGQTVEVPEAPTRSGDKTYTYTFSNWDKAVTTVKADVTYTAEFKATYKEYKVVFKNADNQTLRVDTYHYGQNIQAPKSPTAPATAAKGATFRGWDQPVTICTGNATYLAVFSASTMKYDFNGDYARTDADAIYLLRNGLFPGNYPIWQSGDVNADGKVNEADARYLLWHTMFPQKYPLK